jgi:hypothetical protein
VGSACQRRRGSDGQAHRVSEVGENSVPLWLSSNGPWAELGTGLDGSPGAFSCFFHPFFSFFSYFLINS